MHRVLKSRLFQRFWDVAGAVSIRVKVLGIVLGVIALLSLFVTLQMRTVLADTLRHELEHQGEALNDQYLNDLRGLVLAGDLRVLQAYLGTWREHYSTGGHNTIVDYVRVVDADGLPLVAVPDGGEPVQNHAHGDVIQILTPIPETGYTLELGLASTNVWETVSEVTVQLLTITLVMIAVGFAAAFFLTWILTRPIYDLVAATEAVTRGDFSQRLPRWANDEIGQLTVAFNQMTDSLAQAEQERAERERLRAQYVSNVIAAQEDERKRIARELHDSTGQSLTSLLVGLKNLKETHEPAEIECRIDGLRDVVGRTLDEVRVISWQLRPSMLDDLGLTSALQRYIDDYQQRYAIKVDFVFNAMAERLPVEMETSIYRIIQESLTNVARHAQASTASVMIDRRRSSVRLIVEDNGVGLDLNAVSGKSLGLQGIRERAALFNGRLTIESQPGQGTSLFVELPVPEPTDNQKRIES
jgi:signal transduction histidine kinase